MKSIKAVGVKNLKDNLSAYLREVKRGVRILVTDRDVVIAELREPSLDSTESDKHPLWVSWVEKGWLHPARGKKRPFPKSPVSLPEGTAKMLLDAERGD